jgi:hypothetical protein
MSVVCVVLLTSSQNHQTQARAQAQWPWYVFKRPHSGQRLIGSMVSAAARTSPPAFLFPNQRCQRPVWRLPNPPMRSVAARRGVSRGPAWECQPLYELFQKLWIGAQSSPWGRRGVPHQSFSESIEGAEDRPAPSGMQELFRFLRCFRRAGWASVPRGAAYSRGLHVMQALHALRWRILGRIPRPDYAAWM